MKDGSRYPSLEPFSGPGAERGCAERVPAERRGLKTAAGLVVA